MSKETLYNLMVEQITNNSSSDYAQEQEDWTVQKSFVPAELVGFGEIVTEEVRLLGSQTKAEKAESEEELQKRCRYLSNGKKFYLSRPRGDWSNLRREYRDRINDKGIKVIEERWVENTSFSSYYASGEGLTNLTKEFETKHRNIDEDDFQDRLRELAAESEEVSYSLREERARRFERAVEYMTPLTLEKRKEVYEKIQARYLTSCERCAKTGDWSVVYLTKDQMGQLRRMTGKQTAFEIWMEKVVMAGDRQDVYRIYGEFTALEKKFIAAGKRDGKKYYVFANDRERNIFLFRLRNRFVVLNTLREIKVLWQGCEETSVRILRALVRVMGRVVKTYPEIQMDEWVEVILWFRQMEKELALR